MNTATSSDQMSADNLRCSFIESSRHWLNELELYSHYRKKQIANSTDKYQLMKNRDFSKSFPFKNFYCSDFYC